MSVATTGKRSKRKATEPRTDWKRLRSLTGAQIRARLRQDPDVVPTDAAFWAKARVVMPRSKKTVTMRLDADLLDWFRRDAGYQTRINAVLRSYMNAWLKDAEADSSLSRMIKQSAAGIKAGRGLARRAGGR